MSIYWNSSEISEIYYGENISEVYFGSDLVWSACKYEPGQIIVNQASAGNYTWKCLSNGIFEIVCVGGGSGYAYSEMVWSGAILTGNAKGGSGGGFSIQAKLKKGTAYSYSVGAGGAYAYAYGAGVTGNPGTKSTFAHLTANPGNAAHAAYNGSTDGTGGTQATLTDSETLTIQTINWNKAGIQGGNSILDPYGKGGQVRDAAGNAGYVKITFLSKS